MFMISVQFSSVIVETYPDVDHLFSSIEPAPYIFVCFVCYTQDCEPTMV